MKKNILILLLVVCSICSAQDTIKSKSDSIYGYKHWTKYNNALRFGVGTQKSFYTELGLSRHQFTFNDLGYASSTYYSSIELTPTFSSTNKNIYAIKAGYEINARTLALGIEGKYQTDFMKNDIVITPKIGFGFMGVVNLFYGYNISLMSSLFQNIGHHQFSIVCNLNRKVLKSFQE
jgi:hypothetical protein